MPLRPLDTARGFTSEIIRLRERATGRPRYTVWLRRLKETSAVVYSGIYMTTTLPDGRRAAKSVLMERRRALPARLSRAG